MDLNYGEYKSKKDFDTIKYNRYSPLISLDDENLAEVLAERDVLSPLTEEELSYRDRLWTDIEKVSGGKNTVDYIIAYQQVYLGESFRKIGPRFNVSHMAISKRFHKVIQKLRFLYGVEIDKVPYKRREGSKL